jgi:hypothetical protein
MKPVDSLVRAGDRVVDVGNLARCCGHLHRSRSIATIETETGTLRPREGREKTLPRPDDGVPDGW